MRPGKIQNETSFPKSTLNKTPQAQGRLRIAAIQDLQGLLATKHKSHVCLMENESLGKFSKQGPGSDVPSLCFLSGLESQGFAAVGLVSTRGAGVRS